MKYLGEISDPKDMVTKEYVDGRSGVTGVKGSAESTYRTGNVNIDATDVKAVGYDDVLMTTNNFASPPHKYLYISKIDNSFYVLNKRYPGCVTGTNNGVAMTEAEINALFNGDYDSTGVRVNNGNTMVITIDFTNLSGSRYPGYPYGVVYISFYYVCKPSSISARIYNNYSSQGVGWKDVTVKNEVALQGSEKNIWSFRNDYYGLQKIEITIVGDTTNAYGYTSPTQIEMHLDRPLANEVPYVTKYAPQTLYYDLTAPNFIGTATKATRDSNGKSLSGQYLQRYSRTEIGTSPNFDNPAANGVFEVRNSSETPGETGTKPFNGYGAMLNFKTADNIAMLQLAGRNSGNYLYWRGNQGGNVTMSGVAWRKLLDDTNYTNYTVTKTGAGASGSWAINATKTDALSPNPATVPSDANIDTNDGKLRYFLAKSTTTNRPPSSTNAAGVIQVGWDNGHYDAQLATNGKQIFTRQELGAVGSWSDWVEYYNTGDRTTLFNGVLSYDKIIGTNANLNNTAYLATGRYACTSNSIASTVANLPGSNIGAFVMEVSNTICTPENASTVSGNWIYRTQEITSYTGSQRWIRYCQTDGNGNWLFGSWIKEFPITKSDIGLGNVDNTADANKSVSKAATLTTARTIQTNLASTTAASFDGSANITPGVTGTLPVGNGGTGQTSAINASNAFINALTTGSSDPTDADYYISQYAGGGTTTTTYHRRPHSALWNYIKGKISSVLGLTATSYGGNAATATTLATARTIDGVSFNGSANISHYGSCAISGRNGTVTCSGFTLAAGAWIAVFFPTSNNTTSSETLLLNVNSTGGKEVKYYRSVDESLPANAYVFSSNRTYLLVYDGTDYRLIGDLDTTVTYDEGTAAQLSAGSVLQAELWSPKILHDYIAGASVSYATSAGTATSATSATTATTATSATSATTATTATKANGLTTARAIDGVLFQGLSDITHYGYCQTAAGTAGKAVQVVGFDSTNIPTGSRIAVKFQYTNTAAVGSLTLAINNGSVASTAKYIKYRGANLPSTDSLKANGVYEFVYDGTYWQLVGDLDSESNVVTTWERATITNSTVTFSSGGHYVSGRHCYVQMQLTTAKAISANTVTNILSGMPAPTGSLAVLSISIGNKMENYMAQVTTGGVLRIRSAAAVSTGATVNITGVYTIS